jgi:RHS repeat-associated protein
MIHQEIAQETKKFNKKLIIERLKKIGFIMGILLILFLNGLNVPAQSSGGTTTPQKSETGNKADQNLKSISRVNPSTLAMEMSLSLITYPGRNGNSLPVGFSYSSKIWQMDSSVTWFYNEPYSGNKKYVTDVYAKYADRTSAGWTSMMMPPRLDERLDIYNQYGKPYTEHYSGTTVLSLFEQNIQSLIEEGNSNSVMPCGFGCGSQVRQCAPEGGCSWVCTSWVTQYCTVYGNGGNSETPTQNPDRMHYIKRVRVSMPDGSTHEFRKSDKLFGFCVNSPFNGANCAQNGEDLSGTFLSIDGSAMKLVRPEVNAADQRIFLYLPNGSHYIFPANPQDIQGRFADEFIDTDGNKLAFSKTPATSTALTVNKWTDTLGREIIDPMPHNWDSQNLATGTFDANLPGFDGNTQDFKMKWLHLKPSACETSEDETCGKTGDEVPGALEDQSEILYYSNPKSCHGNLSTILPSGEVLFPANESGQRSCNPFRMEEVNGTLTDVPARFNPVVLAEVELPNGKSYKFKYNRYGEITKITYPTGSYETFEYTQITPPLATFQTQLFNQTNRGVKERLVYSSAHVLEQRWNYSAQTQAPHDSTSAYIITTIAPHKSDSSIVTETGRMKTERYLKRVILPTSGTQNGSFGFDGLLGGMPYDERTYDENGNLRSRTLTEYIVSPAETGADARATRDARPKRTVSIIIEGTEALAVLSELEYDINGNSDREYFSSLNVKQSKSYHYKVITNVNADLETIAGYFINDIPATISETAYLYDANYKARGISSLPIRSRALNPADTNDILGETQTNYDNQLTSPPINYPSGYSIENYGISTSLDCSVIQPSKICWQSPASSYLGNPTTTRIWNKDNNSWIESHVRYDIFGNVIKTKDPIGNEAETIYENTTVNPYFYAYPVKIITPAPDPNNSGHGTTEKSEATTSYDFMTGLVLFVTSKGDLTSASDDLTTGIQYNDLLLRPTRTYAVNYTAPETQTIYNDMTLTVKVRKQIDATNWAEATTFLDSFGRTIKTQAKDSQGDVFIDTEYDLLGRVKRATNPYRQGDTNIYWSKPRYDELGRAVESFAPATGSQTGASLGITSYSISNVPGFIGTVVTSTDASSRKSRAITNALGQLLRVDEPTAITSSADTDLGSLASPNQPTFYSYSPQGKMVKVQQGKLTDSTIQYRYFKYDSLGRLIRVSQPEQESNTSLNLADPVTGNSAWTAGFAYDILGNIKRTTDATGVNIVNEYDKASRVTKRCYSIPGISTTATECSQLTSQLSENTPTVEYFYDGKGLDNAQSPNYAKGKLTKVNNGISQTRYTTFDNFGRLTSSEQRTPVNLETIADAVPRVSLYEYNFSGAMVKETYPSLRVVENAFESDGDLSRIYGKANTNATERTYANSLSYTADGRIERLRLGNGLWESAKFNSRLQVTELALGVGINEASRLKLNYEYGELQSDGTTVDAIKNTGNIAKQTVNFNGLTNPFVQTFKYDSLYRLKEAKETVGTNTNATWKQNFDYDRFGNRISLVDEINGQIQTNTNLNHPTIDANKNRFDLNQGYVYDKNGNLTTDAQNRTFTFNGENKQTEVRDATNLNPLTNIIGRYYYDGEGKRVKKKVFGSTGTVTEETVFVYSNGKLVAEYSTLPAPQSPTTSYTMTDLLDSPRVITNALGEVTSRRDFKPFGEEIGAETNYRTANRKYGTGDNIRQKFTGYQKDAETQLDFAEARMYQNLHGRFTAVDPLLASGKSSNPQTFNRYVYCLNNPLVYTDKNGKWPTETHDLIIGLALPGLNKYQLDRIRYGSALVDTLWGTGSYADIPITLLIANAYMHAMTPGGMTEDEARSLAEQFIEKNLNDAVTEQLNGFGPKQSDYPMFSAEALTSFGQAMHTIMDNTSPAHKGFQVYAMPETTVYWHGVPIKIANIPQWIQEGLEHKALESRPPTREELADNILSLRVNFLATFGNKAFIKAVPDAKQRQKIYDYMKENELNYTEDTPSSFSLKRRFRPHDSNSPAPKR